MADTVEMQDIRGLQIQKSVKGFGLISYIFKNDVTVSNMSGDSVRWYQETSTDLTATSPGAFKNIGRLSAFENAEPSWTRLTSYVEKYGVESTISEEDVQTADIAVLARTLLRLTRAVTKQVDTDIYNTLTESDSPSTIQTFATTAVGGDQWDAASYAGNPIKDLLHAKYLISNKGYDTSNLVCYLHPLDARNLIDWLIAGKGSSIPSFSSQMVQSGVLMNLLGITIKVSPNVTTDNAVVFVPKTAVTWMSQTPLSSVMKREEGLSYTIRIWERGVGLLTDPNSVVYISDLQT